MSSGRKKGGVSWVEQRGQRSINIYRGSWEGVTKSPGEGVWARRQENVMPITYSHAHTVGEPPKYYRMCWILHIMRDGNSRPRKQTQRNLKGLGPVCKLVSQACVKSILQIWKDAHECWPFPQGCTEKGAKLWILYLLPLLKTNASLSLSFLFFLFLFFVKYFKIQKNDSIIILALTIKEMSVFCCICFSNLFTFLKERKHPRYSQNTIQVFPFLPEIQALEVWTRHFHICFPFCFSHIWM